MRNFVFFIALPRVEQPQNVCYFKKIAGLGCAGYRRISHTSHLRTTAFVVIFSAGGQGGGSRILLKFVDYDISGT